MKRSLSFILLCLFFSTRSIDVLFAQAASRPDIQRLDRKVFIGQAYPSGTVYPECFRSKTSCQSLWLKELLLLPLDAAGSVLESSQMKGSFVKVIKNNTKNDGVLSTYIPGAEGMDDDIHHSCGPGEIKRLEQYKYVSTDIGGDYFYAMSDHCERNEG